MFAPREQLTPPLCPAIVSFARDHDENLRSHAENQSNPGDFEFKVGGFETAGRWVLWMMMASFRRSRVFEIETALDGSPPARWKRARQPLSRARRIRRRVLGALGIVALCGALPIGVFGVMSYQQNLALANQKFEAPPRFSKSDRLLILSPHCDDETLGAGGTLAAARMAGAQVRVVFLTNGDGSHATQVWDQARHPGAFLQHRDSSAQYRRLALMRQREATEACDRLKIGRADVVFLGYPDGGTRAMWETNWRPDTPFRSTYTGASRSPYANSRTRNALYCGQSALSDVEGAIQDFRPTVVLTTHPADTHPDHWAAYAYASAALESLRLQPSQAWAKRARLLTFLVHHGLWPAPGGYHPDASLVPPASQLKLNTRWLQEPLSDAARQAKKSALDSYVSQLATTPRFLRAFLRRNELFGVVPHETPNPALQMRDATRDTLWHDLWPAADVREVRLQQISPALRLTLRLAAPPSSRLKYRVALHALDGSSSRAFILELSASGGNWRARLTNQDGAMKPQNLGVKATNDGLQIEIPRELLSRQKPATLLVSADSELGSSRLDQTETGVLRLD